MSAMELWRERQKTAARRVLGYVLAVALTLVTLWVRQALIVPPDGPFLIFAVPIILSAYFGGFGPGAIASVLSALCVDYYLLEPKGSLAIAKAFDLVDLLTFTSVGVAASVASEQRHRNRREARSKAGVLRAQIEAERGRLALRASDANLRLALEAGRLGSWELDLHTGKAITTSRYHNQIFGYDQAPPDWGYAALLRHVLPEDRDVVASSYQAAVEGQAEWHFICRIRRTDGKVRWIEARGGLYRDPRGRLICMHGVVADITERKTAEARIQFLAHHDSLTELPNRLLVKDRITLAMTQADHTGSKVALLFLDLDNFKSINDSLGHSMGDALLRAVASRLRECVRESDTVGRLGGDEFLIVLSDVCDTSSLSAVLDEILDRLSSSFIIDGHNVSITVSIGVACYPDDGDSFDTLQKSADAAMYSAKQAGRNAYRYFDRRTSHDADERLLLRNSLRLALEREEFVLHYQPQVNVANGVRVGAEALIRWRHPDLGLILPGRFIPIAEESGLIASIGEWVLREVCRQSAAWHRKGLRAFVVAANLSAIQFKRGNLEQIVSAALSDAGLDPGCLELELTESILISDIENVRQTLARLKALGIKLSIDDFGTGYSSLAYLKQLAVDKIKIDQSFIRGIASDPNDAAIVRAIIQMTSSLGLTTLAEGVEEERQQAYLRSNHCDEAQGYFYARPMPAEMFAATIF